MSANAIASVGTAGLNMEVSIQYTSCVPKTSCTLAVCEFLSLGDSLNSLDVSFTSCNAACCDGNLCNGQLLPPITTAVPTTTGPSTQSPVTSAAGQETLMCYQSRKAVFTESGSVVSDEKRQTYCDAGSKCLFANATAKAAVNGFEIEVSVNYGSCVPASSCTDDLCDSVTQSDLVPGVNVTFTSCNAYCCNGKLCNDGSTTTPYEYEVTTVMSRESRQCYQSTVSKVNGLVVLNESSTQTCIEGSTCVLTRIIGTAALPGSTERYESDVISASCLSGEIQADHNCTTISSASGRGVSIPDFGFELESCGIEYCETDLCNNIKDIPTQAVATSQPSVEAERTCYNSMQVTVNPFGIRQIDFQESKTCKKNEHCMLVSASYLTQESNHSIEVGYGDCVQNFMCNDELCGNLLQNMAGIGENVTLESCRVTCCDDDLCNSRDSDSTLKEISPHTVASTAATTSTQGPARVLPGSELACFRIQRTVVGGNISANVQRTEFCPSNSKCSYYSTTTQLFGQEVESTLASCMPADLCRGNPCIGIGQLFSADSITKCTSYCCSGFLCNGKEKVEDGTTTEPSEGTTAKPPQALRCHQTLRTTSASGITGSGDTIITCPVGSRCAFTRSTTTVFGVKVETEIGSCMPETLCGNSNCGGLDGFGALTDCSSYCCDFDLCNSPNIATPVTTTQPEIVTTMMTTEAETTTEDEGILTCYSVRQIRSGEQTLDEAVVVSNCSETETGCVLVKATLEGQSDIIPQLQIISGGCTNDEFCGVESCEIVKALIPALPDASFRLAECQAACCKDSNCNSLDGDHDWQTRTGDTGTATPRPIRCYSADITVIGDSEVTNSREEIECSPDSVCALVRLTAWIGGAESSTVIGRCSTRGASRSSSCSQYVRDFEKLYGNTTSPAIVQDCQLSLCEEDLCNDYNGSSTTVSPPGSNDTDTSQ